MKTKKLIQYSALAAGFLSAGNTADAQVIYTDVDPDTLLTPFYDDQYDIDMNADGIADFRFKLHSFGWTIYEGYDYIAQLEALYDNKIGYIIDTSFIECSSWIHTEKVIPVLEEEDTIDAVTNFAGGNILFASVSNDDFPCYDSGYNFGSWLEKTEKFAAVQLEVDAETYYGWIRLSMNGWYEITLHDFAYESIAGVPIIAGRTSGTIAPATMPANNVVLSDINNFGDGRDLQIAFNKAEDEININAYRIYITPSYATPFTIDTALSLPADRFRETPPTGSDIVFNFDETVKDIYGNNITSGITYYTYVLSYNIAHGYPMNMSSVSNGVILNMPLSIDELNNNITIYTSGNNLFINIRTAFYKSDIFTLINIAGEKVFEIKITQQENVCELNIPSGIYIATLQSGDRIYSQKIVLEK